MILDERKEYIVEYPQAVEFAKQQASIFWLPDEIKVEKDIHDILVEMTPAEKHGVITVLKLFTLYEVEIGNEYWGGVVKEHFKIPEVQRMAATFSFFELGVHAVFYNKLNEALGLANAEFYNEYKSDPVLVARMEFLEQHLKLGAIRHGDSVEDLALSLAVFSLMEGAVLYSSFAFLKHFQSQGKNKLNNVVAGINFSVRDEDIHQRAGAWLYGVLCREAGVDSRKMLERLRGPVEALREHEHRIVDMIFQKGKIEGITDVQLKHFVDSRVNKCLRDLGFENMYSVTYNPIADYFYKGISGVVLHDFFNRIGNSYNRQWTESAFTW